MQLPPEPPAPSSPNGRCSVWFSPAEYPSAEIVMSQVTMPIRALLVVGAAVAPAALDDHRGFGGPAPLASGTAGRQR
jgi:hypothetical protein